MKLQQTLLVLAGSLMLALPAHASLFDSVRDRLDDAQRGLDKAKEVAAEPERRQREAERKRREIEAEPERQEREWRRQIDEKTSISK